MKITDSLGRAIEEYTYDVYGKAYINKDLYDKVRRGDLGEALLASQELEDEEVNELAINSEENLLIQNTLWVQYNGKGILNNTRLYTGREFDREIGLYYLRARYYSADLGRFISRDPIGIADDINLYAYVGNSPVMGVDLRGLSKSMVAQDVTEMVYEIFNTADWVALIPPIFELIMREQTGNTKNNNGDIRIGAFNLKELYTKYSDKDGLVIFNGIKVHKANLGNILFGFNIENSGLITREYGENKALEIEKELLSTEKL